MAENITIVTADNWTLEWPTEPGFYLFYGDYKGHGFKPTVQFCEVWDNKDRTAVMSGQFLYRSQVGAFKRLIVEPPDLEALGFEGGEDG